MPELDYDALPGYELRLLRPIVHEGVRYWRATVCSFNHERWYWSATLRPRSKPGEPFQNELGVNFDADQFEDGRWQLWVEALPMRATDMEGLAVALNTALADAARAERRAERYVEGVARTLHALAERRREEGGDNV